MTTQALEQTIGDVLDLPKKSKSDRLTPLTLVAVVDEGLPIHALDKIAEALSPNDQTFIYRLIPKATLARRRRGRPMGEKTIPQRLTAEESARVVRLAKIWAMAKDVWKDEDAARDFLFRSHPLLEGRKPIDLVLANEFGLPLVEGLLGRLAYGSAA